MATYQTYEQVGIKEDISDIISDISPTKTPFQSAIGSEKVKATLFEWQEDSLRAQQANAAVEGADGVDITVTPTVMRNNRTQILTETVKVSGTADAVSTYGRAKESAYQLAKSSAQVKRDLEHAYVGTAQDKVVGDDSTARKLAGFQMQLDSSAIVYSGASDGTKPLIEDDVLTCLQDCYTNGADPSLISVTATNSLIFAAFAKAAGRYRTITDNQRSAATTVVNAVDLYVSPFGETRVLINRFQKAKNTLVYDPSQWAKAVLRPWFRETLAKTGDSLKQMIVGEFSLKHKNFKASGAVIEAASGF